MSSPGALGSEKHQKNQGNGQKNQTSPFFGCLSLSFHLRTRTKKAYKPPLGGVLRDSENPLPPLISFFDINNKAAPILFSTHTPIASLFFSPQIRRISIIKTA